MGNVVFILSHFSVLPLRETQEDTNLKWVIYVCTQMSAGARSVCDV